MVVFLKLTLDSNILLVLNAVVKVCEVLREVTKLELNADELRVRLAVPLEAITVPLLVNTAVVSGELVFRELLLFVETLEKLTVNDEGTIVLVFVTLLSTGVTRLE